MHNAHSFPSLSYKIISGMIIYSYSHSVALYMYCKKTFSHSFHASKKLVEQLFTPHKLYIFISRLCLFWWSTWLFSRVCVSLDYGREVPLLRCHECSRVQIERNNCCEYQSAVCSAVDRNKIHLSVYIIILTVNNWNKRVKILHFSTTVWKMFIIVNVLSSNNDCTNCYYQSGSFFIEVRMRRRHKSLFN